ncbi:hypothetical protein M406DRAFT_341769 [Cryphonectria parasitica EP155]|uniref:DUF7053 domain-containing protein n=1 Tax=Cryphonectria parasitica (strain ATCC 38755 / EP155) TaxID=660469 RepID=A0A9P4XX85_CRYP1|nr:uncharacterized protein M406DRAFT_341769 [Cryphonectria parasitica EP155]KAF3762571.1 hypothetical protein M406DRAFT_341769 [Cryphonectria parasitica EP155]
MSWFSSSSRVVVKTRLPPGATLKQGVDMLHDQDFFINCDPCLQKYELVDRDLASPELPEDRVKGIGPTTSYKITDVVENIPKGVWGSHVESRYEFTDVERGLFCRIRSPLNVVMEALWEVRDAEDGEGLELVEEADIKCSKLLIGIVKSQSEAGAGKIHAKMIDRLKKEVEESSTTDGGSA